MPSPFPGMDPFLETQEWDDFHSRLNLAIADAIQPQLERRYFVRVERRVYVEHPMETDEQVALRIGDVAIVADTTFDGPSQGTAGGAVATLEPLTCTVATAEERRETFLVIRDGEEQRVVTVIETLSPSNKRRGGDGWSEYLKKRDQVLGSPSHLVELDLLRGGARMPVRFRKRPPPYDYRVLISRGEQRPRAEAYVWPLLHPLPTVGIPLLRGDRDVPLDLQQVFAAVYERAAYDRSLDYTAELDPPLPEVAREALRGAARSRTEPR